jgi:hypothetical protein
MGSGKSGKKRRARRQKQNARARRLVRARQEHSPAEPDDLVVALARLAGYTRGASTFEEAAAAARADVMSAVDQIAQLSVGRSVSQVVQGVRTAMAFTAMGADGAYEPPAAHLELVALVLVCRDAVTPPSGDPSDADRGFNPEDVRVAAAEAMAAGAMLPLFEAPPSSDPFSQVLFQSTQREIMMRNPVYPHMLLDTLRGLFGDAAVESDCRDVLGFTGLEAVNVLEQARLMSITALQERFDRLLAARDAMLPVIRAHRAAAGADGKDTPESLPEEHTVAIRGMMSALDDLTTNVGDSAVLDVDELARRTGYPVSSVTAVLDAFTLNGLVDIAETVERFFTGDNPLRTAPIITDGDGSRMLVHDGLALPAVREVIESRLKAAGKVAAYDRHRGQWVEDHAVDLLAGLFPGAAVHRGFDYFIPDPEAAPPQTSPRDYTKRVEADGLILIDDVALIIEVKSVALTAEARAGVSRRLRGKLRDIVTAAAKQADRLRQRILNDGALRLNDGEWLDVSGVREVHTIAVGLEDLSGVTTATALLVHAGVLVSGHIPWTVSVHDLRIICELTERPSELLLYLRRRTQPETTSMFLAVDELDLFLLFQGRGLFVEPDPNRLAEIFPGTGPPSVAAQRRYAEQQPEMIPGRTRPLDAWYASVLDPAKPPADKPRFTGDQKLLHLVDAVTALCAPGWLSTATLLLEGSAKAQHSFGGIAAKLAREVKRDGQHHMLTWLTADSTGRPCVLVWVCAGLDESDEDLEQELTDYLAAKKYQVKAYRAACMVFDPRTIELRRIIFDNRISNHDEKLERRAQQLVPPGRMTGTLMTGSRRPGKR